MRLRDRWVITSTLMASFAVVGCQTPSSFISRDEAKARDPQRLIEIARTFENQGYKKNAMAIYGQLANGSPFAAEARERYIALGGQLQNMQRESSSSETMIADGSTNSRSDNVSKSVVKSVSSASPNPQPPKQLETEESYPVVETQRQTFDVASVQKLEESGTILSDESTHADEKTPSADDPASVAENEQTTNNELPELTATEADIFPTLTESKSVAEPEAADSKVAETVEVTEVTEIVEATKTITEETTVVETVTVETTNSSVVQSESNKAEWKPSSDDVEKDVEQVTASVSRTSSNLDEFIPPPLPEDQISAAKPLQSSVATDLKDNLAELCHGASEEVLEQVRKLSSGKPSEKISACFELAKLGEKAKAATPALESSLSSQDNVFKAHAASALYKVGGNPSSAVQALIEILKSNDSGAVQLAAYYLGKMRPDAIVAVEELNNHLSSGVNLVSLHCAEAILKLEPDNSKALEVMVSCIHAEDNMVRWMAAQSASNIGSQDKIIVDALESLLYDSDTRIQTAAALSIGGFGELAKPTMPRLLELTSAEDVQLQDAAKTSVACLKKTNSEHAEEE